MRTEILGLDMERIRAERHIIGARTGKPWPITLTQLEYLGLLRSGMRIRELVAHRRKQGQPISFQALDELLRFLAAEHMIKDPEFRARFAPVNHRPAGILSKLTGKLFGKKEPVEDAIEIRQEVSRIPFFRVLQPEILETFLKYAKVVHTPPGIFICQAHQNQRGLFVMLRGSASVYRHEKNGHRVHLATLAEGSVFGEVGFFLGEPRTADVVSDTESVVLHIKYEPRKFNFAANLGREIQRRLWMIRALQQSEVFSALPDDCFDALVTAGRFRTFPAGHLVCKEGDPGNTCYLIATGRLTVSKQDKPMAQLKQGDCFGELALIKSGGLRTATVRADDEVLALELTETDFHQLLAENLALGCEVERLAATRLKS